jgi:hypothetical protein
MKLDAKKTALLTHGLIPKDSQASLQGRVRYVSMN